MKVEIFDTQEGLAVVGTVTAPSDFFISDGFKIWRDLVMKDCMERAISRANREGDSYVSSFNISVWR